MFKRKYENERPAPIVITNDDVFRMPAPSEQSVDRTPLSKGKARAKKRQVKPIEPLTFKPREKTWLKIESPRRYPTIGNDGFIVPSLPFDVIESEQTPVKAEVILLNSHRLVRRIVPYLRILQKQFAESKVNAVLRDLQYIETFHAILKTGNSRYDTCDLADLREYARQANVCLICHKALREARETDKFAGTSEVRRRAGFDTARCHWLYVPVCIAGTWQYRLWIEPGKLAERVRRERVIGDQSLTIIENVLDGYNVTFRESVWINQFCNC